MGRWSPAHLFSLADPGGRKQSFITSYACHLKQVAWLHLRLPFHTSKLLGGWKQLMRLSLWMEIQANTFGRHSCSSWKEFVSFLTEYLCGEIGFRYLFSKWSANAARSWSWQRHICDTKTKLYCLISLLSENAIGRWRDSWIQCCTGIVLFEMDTAAEYYPHVNVDWDGSLPIYCSSSTTFLLEYFYGEHCCPASSGVSWSQHLPRRTRELDSTRKLMCEHNLKLFVHDASWMYSNSQTSSKTELFCLQGCMPMSAVFSSLFKSSCFLVFRGTD